MEETLKAFAIFGTWVAVPNYEAKMQEALENLQNGQPGDLLKILLRYYIFERAGASSNYSAVSSDLLGEMLNNNNLQQITPQKFWQEFCGRIEGGMNKDRNPLYYDENHPEKNVICVFQNAAMIQELVNGLDDPENVTRAYECFAQIRGVGSKIASLILRDLSKFLGTRFANLNQIQPETYVYWLMQPVDTHVGFVATTLGICEKGDDSKTKAMEICRRCIEAEVNPLWFNAGAWNVAKNLITPHYRLAKILTRQDQDDHSRAVSVLREGVNLMIAQRETLKMGLNRLGNEIRDYLGQEMLEEILTIVPAFDQFTREFSGG